MQAIADKKWALFLTLQVAVTVSERLIISMSQKVPASRQYTRNEAVNRALGVVLAKSFGTIH